MNFPDDAEAFFITSYPKFGESRGRTLVHDPIFVAYFEVPPYNCIISWNNDSFNPEGLKKN